METLYKIQELRNDISKCFAGQGSKQQALAFCRDLIQLPLQDDGGLFELQLADYRKLKRVLVKHGFEAEYNSYAIEVSW